MVGLSMDQVFVTGAVEVKRILDFELKADINEHAVLILDVIVDRVSDESCWNLIGKKVILRCEIDGGNVPLFTGIIQKLRFKHNHGEYEIKLKCISASYEFDKEKKCCFYQNQHMTYAQVLDCVAGKGRNILFTCGSGLEIKTPLLQYEETDWEFCKRIASWFGSVVIPEISSEYPQISVGVIDGKEYRLEDCNGYECRTDWEEYRKKRLFYRCRIEDFFVYTVMGNLNYMLGDKIWFKGEKKIVISKHVFLKRGFAQAVYKLGSEVAAGIMPFYNGRICGLSLSGCVKWSFREKIKVSLEIDHNRNLPEEELYAFDYAPVSGTIMYAMPETGARVWLYFPNEKEDSGIVVESIGEEQEYPEAFDKIFETKEKKRLELKPDQMTLKSEASQNNMVLSDRFGVDLFSQKEIHIAAGKNVKVQTGGTVTMNTPIGYHFENTKSGDCIDMSGNEMLMTTERAVISGLPHKLGHKPLQSGQDIGIGNPYQYASSIIGGIPQGRADSPVASAVLGGLPLFQNPVKEHQISDLIFLGRNSI